ncbi:hypothetical protein PVAP13_3KG488701 [Panicum virgatum]|uniref:DUF4220 domain-containing protein n=1 Tax=Panicum virgatum TaxID=38727 RepID=A0A8T0UZM2_PANVG|nr:hypothetical protein PVAP13_3KG488701 [Panicum virgatum]
MGFNPPVPQRDSDWEIRAVRIASSLPRFASWSCYLLADWVADLALGLLVNNLGNIGGNDVSLSTVADVTKRGGTATTASGGGNPSIFAFWTPFLLLHLGGPDTLTAYSIEDNELWFRHLMGLLFQLLAACVVFSCTLQGNPVIPATVLVLVAGVIKYGERTFSLYSASVDGVLATIIPAPNPGPNYAKLMTVFDSKQRAGLAVDIVQANGLARGSRKDRDRNEVKRQALATNKTLEEQAYELRPLHHLPDQRNISQAFFLDRGDMTARCAWKVTELELNFMYEMVHTKEPVAHSLAGCIFRFVCSACIAGAAVIFARLDKASIRHVDVAITYALLIGALALDVVALAMLVFSSNWTLVFLDKFKFPRAPLLMKRLARLIRQVRPKLRRWSETTSQLNLISYCLGKLDPNEASGTLAGPRLWTRPRAVRALAKVAHTLGAREMFDDMFFVRREPLRIRDDAHDDDLKAVKDNYILLKFIFEELTDAANQVRSKSTVGGVADKEVSRSRDKADKYRKSRHEDVEEMRKACSYRGERALKIIKEKISVGSMGEKDGDDGWRQRQRESSSVDVNWYVLMDSVIDRDFDESLLMWHIATDLCYLSRDSSAAEPSSKDDGGGDAAVAGRWKSISKTLSEYMLYLLVKQPKILAASAGIGQMAYQDTCAEARRFFESAAVWEPDHEGARRMLRGTNTSVPPEVVKGGRSKSVLFHACIIAKELTKLDNEVMWEVVVKLARGGELITMVWLLMAHLGIGNIYQKAAEDDATPKLIITAQ